MDSAALDILVVEDEADIRTLLLFLLKKDGYAPRGAASGEEGLRSFAARRPALVILDLMLPGMDGMAVCRKIRQLPEGGDTPVLMLTARSGEEDTVLGLEAGADDYVAKPFSNRVLLARVRSLLRRSGAMVEESGLEGRVSVGEITLCPEKREVSVKGRRVELTAGEFKMLQVMLRRPGIVFTRNQLLDLVRGATHAVTDRAVDVQIVGLRKKLGDAGNCIETVRGVGYRLSPERR